MDSDHGGRGDGWNLRECRDHAGREKGGAGLKRGWPTMPKGDGAQKTLRTQEFGWPACRLHRGVRVDVPRLAVFCKGAFRPVHSMDDCRELDSEDRLVGRMMLRNHSRETFFVPPA